MFNKIATGSDQNLRLKTTVYINIVKNKYSMIFKLRYKTHSRTKLEIIEFVSKETTWQQRGQLEVTQGWVWVLTLSLTDKTEGQVTSLSWASVSSLVKWGWARLLHRIAVKIKVVLRIRYSEYLVHSKCSINTDHLWKEFIAGLSSWKQASDQYLCLNKEKHQPLSFVFLFY